MMRVIEMREKWQRNGMGQPRNPLCGDRVSPLLLQRRRGTQWVLLDGIYSSASFRFLRPCFLSHDFIMDLANVW